MKRLWPTMFSSNVTRILPSREGLDDGDRPLPAKQPRVASRSPDLPHITSNIQRSGEPPLVAVTSDLPQFGGAPKPKRALSPPHRPPKPTASTPGRSRLEVVINISPYKHQPGEKIWDTDLGEEHEVSSRNLASGRKRSHKPAPPTTAPITQPTGKRPRGRPKGWRPGMPSTKTGQLTASHYKYVDKAGKRILKAPPPAASSSAPATGQKRRGRPPRPPSPTPRGVWETMAPPRYVPFLCEWAGCKAELQNVETLRRHVRKIHGPADPLVCRWGGCGRGEREHPPAFAEVGKFHEHMDERHLLPYVWHVGDGHRNRKRVVKPTEEGEPEVPAYLLGPDGEQVTPWVKEQQQEDFQTWRNNRRRLKEILLQRDANAPLEEGEDGEESKENGDTP